MMKRVNIFGSVLTAIAALVFVACNSNDELDELRNGEIADNISRAADNEDQEEPQLVKVTYRKDWYWTPAYANLMTAYHPIVYRDRTYETGETFTDTFQDYGHLGDLDEGFNVFDEIVPIWDGSFVVYSPVNTIRMDDNIEFSYLYASQKQGVPNLSLLEYGGGYPGVGDSFPLPVHNWNEYVASKLYEDMNLDVDLTGVEVIGSGGTSNKKTGWYFEDGYDVPGWHYFYHGTTFGGSHLGLRMWLTDQYLVIDGQMITFRETEFRGNASYMFNEQDATLTNGAPAKILSMEARFKFYGRDYYASVIDTVYQMSEAEIQAYSTQTAAQAPAPANSMFPNIPASIVDDGQPKFIYGGKPKGRKGMF